MTHRPKLSKLLIWPSLHGTAPNRSMITWRTRLGPCVWAMSMCPIPAISRWLMTSQTLMESIFDDVGYDILSICGWCCWTPGGGRSEPSKKKVIMPLWSFTLSANQGSTFNVQRSIWKTPTCRKFGSRGIGTVTSWQHSNCSYSNSCSGCCYWI